MDFIRAAIKGLFYDYPPELFVESVLKKGENASREDVFNPFVNLLKFREMKFTTTELKALEDVVIRQWCNENHEPKDECIPGYAMPFLLLSVFVGNVLRKNSHDEPVVDFDMLLRWRETSMYVGEDLLTTVFLAKQDVINGSRTRLNFTWSDVIEHDDDDVNAALSVGLSDNHCHYGASIDVASFQWIGLMNHIGPYALKKEKVFEFFNMPMLSLWEYDTPLSFRQWGILAAAIRVLLYDVLYDNLEGLGLLARVDLINRMISSKDLCVSEAPFVQSMIGSRSLHSYRLLGSREGQDWDYAIPLMLPFGQSWLQSPYMLQYGERRMMYDFLRKLYGHDTTVYSVAPYFYLYHLIKTRYRRELIQSNGLLGIDNFKKYNERKKAFMSYSAEVKDWILKYVCHTGVNNCARNHAELRMSIKEINAIDKKNIYAKIFDSKSSIKCDQICYVPHFFKAQDYSYKTDGLIRHNKAKNGYSKEARQIVERIRLQNSRPSGTMPQILGIDAAGSEIGCRPEVFGQEYRGLRNNGVRYFTYHAGEDFYDLLDGMRMIDEAVLFLQLGQGDRIGHAVALGLPPESYYDTRKRNSVLPRQVWLDNLIWLKYRSKELGVRLSESTAKWVNEQTCKLYEDCGFPMSFNEDAYRLSMLLRSDEMKLWSTEEVLNDERHKILHTMSYYDKSYIRDAMSLCRLYQTKKDIKDAGNQSVTVRIPLCLYQDIVAMQEAMMDMLETKGIGIECCPSSNLLLCPIDKYIDHPLFRFHPAAPYRNHKIKVTVCTDDRGIFATSLRNEYSLLACAMIKTEKWSKQEVVDYLKHLVEMGNELRFCE